jgi:hypothetical protein
MHVLFVGVFLASTAAHTGTRDPHEPAEQTSVALAINPAVDLHFHVRTLAASGEEIPSAYAEAVQAALAFEESVGGRLGWGFIEPLLTLCQTAGDLVQLADTLPERFRLRSGPVVRPREAAVPYAQALAKLDAGFQRATWPDHRAAIERARLALEELLEDDGVAALRYITKYLRMDVDPRLPTVYLVAGAPSPGASTSASPSVGIVSFVAVSDRTVSALAEVVLHEATHNLDIATRGKATALNRLRMMLRDAGMPPSDPLMRDMPHTIVFVQAAEAVRLFVDPEHEHDGSGHSFYEKAPEAAKLVLPHWKAHLADELTLDHALDAMVAGAVQPAPAADGQQSPQSLRK